MEGTYYLSTYFLRYLPTHLAHVKSSLQDWPSSLPLTGETPSFYPTSTSCTYLLSYLLSTNLPTCLPVYLSSYLQPTYLSTYLPTNLPTHPPTDLPNYLPPYHLIYRVMPKQSVPCPNTFCLDIDLLKQKAKQRKRKTLITVVALPLSPSWPPLPSVPRLTPFLPPPLRLLPPVQR